MDTGSIAKLAVVGLADDTPMYKEGGSLRNPDKESLEAGNAVKNKAAAPETQERNVRHG